MSKELQKSDKSSLASKSAIGKSKIGKGLLAGSIASLSTIELPRMFNQLVIFLLDGSGSMTYPGSTGKSKGLEVHQSVVTVLERLKESKNKSSFDVAFRAYANETVEMYPIRSAKEMDLVKDCFNPCEFIKDYSSTKLTQALDLVEIQAREYIQKYKDQNTKVLIIILGDGAISDYKECLTKKDTLLQNPLITFSSILFESPDWSDKMDTDSIERLKDNYSKLASSNADYMSTVDPEKIRGHMIQSITKLSNIG